MWCYLVGCVVMKKVASHNEKNFMCLKLSKKVFFILLELKGMLVRLSYIMYGLRKSVVAFVTILVVTLYSHSS